MDLDREGFETISPEAEPGMNFISADFDLVMVNRANERLYGKPMVALLGKKCYREFEKRDAPCPHCPGRLALATGEAHEAETEGVRDDGSRFNARVRAHPVMGPDNRPTGFIEVVEDITEQKRMESLARIDAELLSALAGVQNIRKALRETLEAALRVEGINCGGAYLLDSGCARPTLVVQRNLTSACQGALADLIVRWLDERDTEPGPSGAPASGAAASGATASGATASGATPSGATPSGATPFDSPSSLAGVEGAPRALAAVPVLHRSRPVAVMVVGTTTYPGIPSTLRAGLNGLGATVGNAIARIRAEQSRGDAVADLETVIINAPIAAWTQDATGHIAMWNKAAERLLGWRASEVLHRSLPFADAGEMGMSAGLPSGSGIHETSLAAKDGHAVEVRLVVSSFRDVVGCASTTIVMAEDLFLSRRVVELEARLRALDPDFLPDAPLEHPDEARYRASAPPVAASVLVIDADERRGCELVDLLSSLGCAACRYDSVDEAAPALLTAETDGSPFDLAIVDLIAPGGAHALEQKAALRSVGFSGPVIVSSDSELRGHEHHGFAGAIRRPYTAELVSRSVRRGSVGAS